MVDHEGKVKEIEWHFEQTGERSGDIYPTIHEYQPENVPDHLLSGSAPTPAAAPCLAAAAAAAVVPALTALEAALALMLAGAVLAWLYSLLSLRRPRQPPTPATADDPSAPIVLADFPRCPQEPRPGLPVCSHSSYVTKVEAFLRFGGVPYVKRVGYPGGAASPKAQLPYIERGGQRVGDSHYILKHLIGSGEVPAEMEFPPGVRDKAAAVAVARMCDTDLAVAVLYDRWVDPQGWARCRRALLGAYRLPPGVAWVVARTARKSALTRVLEQGYGRHSQADRLALVGEELAALSALLGDRAFMFGDAPHAVDAAVFGVVDQLAARELNPALAELVEAHPNLVAYRERIRARYFADYGQSVEWLDGPEADRFGGEHTRVQSGYKAAKELGKEE